MKQQLQTSDAPPHVKQAVQNIVDLRCAEHSMVCMADSVTSDVLGKLLSASATLTSLDASTFEFDDVVQSSAILDAQERVAPIAHAAKLKMDAIVSPVCENLSGELQALKTMHSKNPGVGNEKKTQSS